MLLLYCVLELLLLFVLKHSAVKLILLLTFVHVLSHRPQLRSTSCSGGASNLGTTTWFPEASEGLWLHHKLQSHYAEPECCPEIQSGDSDLIQSRSKLAHFDG